MTPKEKAKELIDKFLPILFGKKPFYKKSDYFKAKKFALICVDEIKNAVSHKDDFKYWQEVKQEIENYEIH